MSNIQVSRDVLFEGIDLLRNRWAVEQEKLDQKFTGLSFRALANKITHLSGNLYTSYGNCYYIKISIPDNYPYELPSISLPEHKIESKCPHIYKSGNICVMKSEQWSSTYSLAFLVTRVALWLNKYDYWKKYDMWPGNQQIH